MTADTSECVVCRSRRGERKPDSQYMETMDVMGEEVPVEVTNVTVDYVDIDGYWHQHPLCDEHQRQVDSGRRCLVTRAQMDSWKG